MLSSADILLTAFHLALIIFNLTGWIWKRTRKAHLISLGLTTASWFILGIWKGWGYCVLTDWQWQIKEKLGETNLPNSLIKYHIDKITGTDISPSVIDTITLTCLLLAVSASLYVNFFMKKKRKQAV